MHLRLYESIRRAIDPVLRGFPGTVDLKKKRVYNLCKMLDEELQNGIVDEIARESRFSAGCERIKNLIESNTEG